MAARAGMTDLIKRLREMCECGAGDYAVNGVTYWSDEDLQSALDETRRRVDMLLLTPRPRYEAGVFVYKRYEWPWGVGNAFEGMAGGDEVFRVTDSLGTDIDPDGYSFGGRDLAVSFTADQAGAARYWSGYAYDLASAGAAVWRKKAGHYAVTAVNFSSDGQRFDREAIYQHCVNMAALYGRQAGGGSRVTPMRRGDLTGAAEAGGL